MRSIYVAAADFQAETKNHLPLWFAIVEATNVCMYGAQGVSRYQHLCACFERLGLARAWPAEFVPIRLLGADTPDEE